MNNLTDVLNSGNDILVSLPEFDSVFQRFSVHAIERAELQRHGSGITGWMEENEAIEWLQTIDTSMIDW